MFFLFGHCFGVFVIVVVFVCFGRRFLFGHRDGSKMLLALLPFAETSMRDFPPGCFEGSLSLLTCV